MGSLIKEGTRGFWGTHHSSTSPAPTGGGLIDGLVWALSSGQNPNPYTAPTGLGGGRGHELWGVLLCFPAGPHWLPGQDYRSEGLDLIPEALIFLHES